MWGLVTRRRSHAGIGDEVYYEIKDVLGRRLEPLANTHNMISCFADNKAVEQQPELAAVSENGMRAVRSERYFDWDCVCPSRREYRNKLLSLVEQVSRSDAAGVRLDDVGFPREGFCYCPVCQEQMATARSNGITAGQWRTGLITDFVKNAADLVRAQQKPLSLTLYPDPYGNHQWDRFGVDLTALSNLVDWFVVPLYDIHYGTTYWLETIAWAFRDVLDAPFRIELYALGVDDKPLLHAAEVAEHYASGVLFAYENNTERNKRLLDQARTLKDS